MYCNKFVCFESLRSTHMLAKPQLSSSAICLGSVEGQGAACLPVILYICVRAANQRACWLISTIILLLGEMTK